MNVEIAKALVTEQLESITDKLIRDGIKGILVEPFPHLRKWDYSMNEEKFICWTIGIDNVSSMSFVYSEFGFGPQTPWGLVPTENLYFGMDSVWFDNLKDCFLNSSASHNLPIWRVVRVTSKNVYEIIAEDILFDNAFDLKNKAELDFPKYNYFVSSTSGV